jgi:cell division protein ZapA (FtsZ GTPase activity inhibitor)
LEIKTEAVKVRLFGREYSIKGHGDKRYVQKLAEFITQRADIVQRHGTVVSTLDVVVLTLLNITDELFQYKQVKEQTIKELEAKTEKLLEAMDRTI